MFLYHLKVALRNLIKNKLNTILTMLGFGTALTIVILVGLYSYKEITTNQFHKDKDLIFKVSGWSTPTALAPFLRQNIPEIEFIARIDGGGAGTISLINKEENPITLRYLISENDFFNVFTYPIIKGDKDSALLNPNSIVLDESIAKTLFGEKDPIGKNAFIQGQNFTVTAVMEDPPHNSSLRFDAVISRFHKSQNDLANKKLWEDWNLETFAKFYKGFDKEIVTKKMQETLAEKGQLMYDVKHVKLYSLKDVYFNKGLYSRFVRGDKKNVNSMIWIGIIVLVLAIVNFFNLSTSQAISRCKEIGIRKVNGVKRKTLINQFLTETFVLSFLSMLFAMAVFNIVLQWFNNYINSEFEGFYFTNFQSWGVLFIGALALALIAGSYPSVYLSSFNPIDAIKNGAIKSKGVTIFKRTLITFQFTASILLIIIVLFITKQIHFLKTKDLGFEKEHIICLYPTQNIFKSKTAFVSKLTENPAILGVSFTQGVIGNWDHGFKLKTKVFSEEKEIWSKQIFVDTAYAKVFDIELTNTLNVDKNEPYILLNESAINNLDVSNYLGIEIQARNTNNYKPLAGVVKNFHFKSLYHGIEPLTIYVNPNLYGLANVRFNPKSYKSTKDLITYCEKIFKEIDPNGAFNYQFLDDVLSQSYDKERKYRFLIFIFSGFAVFISCLGLFGMIIFSNAKRRKEIGVRKVSGASISLILKLLVLDYIKWIGLSFIIAIPIAYYVINSWLSSFPYKTPLSWWVFALAGAFILVIAMLTVSWQSYIAAARNPVESLRDE